MRAVVQDRYGPPELLRITELPEPEPGPGQVQLRVAATSINLSDWENLVGSPAYARIGGLRRPRRPVLGSDIAGRVTAVGPGVTDFAVGDEVYGDNLFLKGGFAEYAVAPVTALALRPDGLSAVDAATIPQSGAIALQGTASVTEGDRVLVNGAGGGSGTFAVQLAKRAGAHVTGVDNGTKLDFMSSLGCDEVIDYRSDDFTRGRPPYDLILDMVTGRSVFAYRRALARGGRYGCTGGPARALLRVATLGGVVGLATGRRIGMLVIKEGPEHFEPLARLCVAGEVATRVDSVVPLDEAPAALARVGAGRALGKVVVVPG
ncbi:NAD(P)-dependent alcohol dehydrogenase [Nocardioides sp. GY 10113]|uniref:NAD(P)-dependent alcohol dehydrogenase n=1 Tax=Nocardioides sp. GY 10113 TaxID=2569761 RepID=UPI0010A836F3|nr:NAD(P)-dependent alcohol dehydrogenase [Nocardioides sp. GY 10113]TIC87709.1 NAD(P)-dependent alcohol dehydrogenase [Nocardioides sp. GY 10113]